MPIAIDTETTIPTNAEPVPRLVSVAVASPTGCQLFAVHDPAWVPVVVAALVEGAIFANAPFDIHVLLRAHPELLPHVIDAYAYDRIFDVQTREKLIDIAEGMHFQRGKYNLGAVARRRAGIEVDKNDPWRKRYGELLGLEIVQWPEEARQYAIADAASTWAVWHAQEAFRAAHTLDVFADAGRQARGHLALYAQTLRGIHTDPGAVEAVDRRLLTEITQCSLACLDAGLARVGGTKKVPQIVRNTKAAAAMLAEHCAQVGIGVVRTDPTAKHPAGQVSLSESVLNAAQLPEGHPLDAYRRLGGLQSTRTKNIPILRRPLIRTKYDECVGSGRTSSSGPQREKDPTKVPDWAWIGTNLQNQQRTGGFRECLVPPPGHVFVISDYAGMELGTLAQVQIDLFGRSALGDMLRAGRDPHGEFAAAMLGIPVEQFDKSIPEHKAARQAAKPWNFGKPGGMGALRFIEFARNDYGVELTREEERAHTNRWHALFPEMRLFFNYVSSLEGPGGYTTIIQPRSGRIRGRLRFPDACNTHFQGLAADAAKLALWWLWLAGLDPASSLFGGVPVVRPDGRVSETGQCLFVHDENVTAVRRELAEAAKVEQERIMIEAFRVFCPDVPIKVESTITERYTK